MVYLNFSRYLHQSLLIIFFLFTLFLLLSFPPQPKRKGMKKLNRNQEFFQNFLITNRQTYKIIRKIKADLTGSHDINCIRSGLYTQGLHHI